MLRRKIQSVLKDYFQSDSNKVLLLDGARQIGKSFIIRYEGNKFFKNYVEINFLEDKNGERLFENVSTTKDFYLKLSAIAGDKMGPKKDTLIFLDEIQAYPELLTLLKFLKDEDRFTYIASGSLLGVTMNKTLSKPGGRILKKKMYPLDFEEFLWANGVGAEVISYMREQYRKEESIDESLHRKFLDLFKKYLLVGGLPDAVNTFIDTSNIVAVRAVHDEIFGLYKEDASQYDSDNSLKIRRIYEMIPSNMENKKKRLHYQDIEEKKGKRNSDYEAELEYLISSGISLEVLAVSNPKFPLRESEQKKLIKLYLNDVGLLTNLLYRYNINAVIVADNSINLGAVYETAVAQELIAHDYVLRYYDNKTKGEVDFIVDDYDTLSALPIEVKSGNDFKRHRALDKFVQNEDYNIKNAILFSNSRDVQRVGKVIYMPIYYVMFLEPSVPEEVVIN
ncbi:MAG: ATP-binding protein [Lentimicrobiaceae bacterium]|nr:ATP-binding protein [Lentimicrobiaceae bacterium]